MLDEGEGPLVVLCHGFPELAFSWRWQVPALAGAGFRVVAPDMRGYGGSSAPAEVEAYDVVSLCGDLCGLLDALGEQAARVRRPRLGRLARVAPRRSSPRARARRGWR